ncbi:MAG: hypothetical protein ACRD4Q_06220, partial [Candidatus Acidiferrales bacterium]
MFQPLERTHSAGHALAIIHPPLPAYFNFKDGLVAPFVLDDGHVAELQAPRFIRTQAGVGGEQDVVVKLFRFLFVTRILGLVRAASCCFVKFFVFLRGEPCPVRDFR